MFVGLLSDLKSIKSKTGIGAIKAVRKLLVNTPVNDWRSTGAVREWVYKNTNAAGVIETEYFNVKLRLPGHDLGLAPGLQGGYYEKLQLQIYSKLALKSPVIFDVGANIGLYAVIGGKNLKKNGHVIAFEPIPSNIEFLQENIKINNLKNVKVVAYAVGEDERSLELYLSSKSVGNHSAGGEGDRDYDSVLEVQQTSIDKYITTSKLTKIDLIKIDVEGYDGHVLKGALKTIAMHKPTIMVECIPKLLKRCGFEPAEFAKILFENYEHCYLINEANNTVEKVNKDNFEIFLKRLNDANLVLTDRSDHKSIVDEFITGN